MDAIVLWALVRAGLLHPDRGVGPLEDADFLLLFPTLSKVSLVNGEMMVIRRQLHSQLPHSLPAVTLGNAWQKKIW